MSSKINYVFHYDALTWMPALIARPFNEICIPYMGRSAFVKWLDDNIKYPVYVWPGVITPDLHQQNWGHLVSPKEYTSFLIFTDDSDQTRYLLEFSGSDNPIHIRTHKDGLTAYHSRKR